MNEIPNPHPTIDLGYPTEAVGAIPSFANIDEEAEWWDTHDVDGYVVELAEEPKLP